MAVMSSPARTWVIAAARVIVCPPGAGHGSGGCWQPPSVRRMCACSLLKPSRHVWSASSARVALAATTALCGLLDLPPPAGHADNGG
jgi:hypothetical protein